MAVQCLWHRHTTILAQDPPDKSSRGLEQSKTLRAIRKSSANAFGVSPGEEELDSWPQCAIRESSGLQVGDAVAQGVANEFGDAPAREFFHQTPAVGFDGFDAHVQTRGDFLGAQAVGDQAQDFPFAGRQAGFGLGGGGQDRAIILERRCVGFGAQVKISGQDGVDGLGSSSGVLVFRR